MHSMRTLMPALLLGALGVAGCGDSTGTRPQGPMTMSMASQPRATASPSLASYAVTSSTPGTLYLTNIHQLYESRDQEWTPKNAIEALLGKKPPQDLAASGQRSMLERVKSLKNLVVMNDEAHHVHDKHSQPPRTQFRPTPWRRESTR